MRSHTVHLTMNVPARMDFVNITRDVEKVVAASGVREGLCLVNAMHITASVFINDDEPGLHDPPMQRNVRGCTGTLRSTPQEFRPFLQRVRCLVRDPARLEGRPWLSRVEVVRGDALLPNTLVEAMKGVSVAYYLIHGKQGGRINAERDLAAARNFVAAAEETGIDRIIYLGELVDPTSNLSPYLRSRHETGYSLRYSHIPVTEFRAGMIVGSGSVLFEMIRYISERQPVFVCPAWYFSPAQPGVAP